ncbi:MAG: AraC family ligand binding domain-containing protein, partial [Oscillospiraceae bacterium]
MNKQDFQWQYYTFNRTSNCSLWVCQCGFEECLNGYEFGPTIRDHYLIHFVVDGNGTFKSSKGNFPVKKGQGFLITPQEITTYCADQVAPWRYYWVGFKGVEAESLIKLCGISQDKPIFDFDIEKSVSFLEEMLHTDKKSATCEYQMVGYLYLLLSTIMDDSVVKKSKETFTNRYLTKAVEFINQNYNKDINVTKISKEIGIDRTYLYRIF